MRFRKNRKRIDPRYFLNETTDIDRDGDTDIEDVKSVVDAAAGGGGDPLQRLATEHEKSLKTVIGMYVDHDRKYGGRERKQFRDADLKSAFEAAFEKVALEQDPQSPVGDFLAGRNLDQVPDWAVEYMNNMYDGVVAKATEELESSFGASVDSFGIGV